MTEEPYIHRQLMRMHGFSLMSMVLTELVGDRNIIKLVCPAEGFSLQANPCRPWKA